MNKTKLRQEYRSKRTNLSNQTIDSDSLKIANLLFDNFNLDRKIVHTFISIKKHNEINTTFINNILFNKCKEVATSITIYKPLSLVHSIITKNTVYKLDQFNIPTPTEPKIILPKELDVVLIPLLVFDNKGNRIGYGKGLYDTFLEECNKDCIKIGLSLFEPHSEPIITESHDIKLDYCVTPNKTYQFK